MGAWGPEASCAAAPSARHPSWACSTSTPRQDPRMLCSTRITTRCHRLAQTARSRRAPRSRTAASQAPPRASERVRHLSCHRRCRAWEQAGLPHASPRETWPRPRPMCRPRRSASPRPPRGTPASHPLLHPARACRNRPSEHALTTPWQRASWRHACGRPKRLPGGKRWPRQTLRRHPLYPCPRRMPGGVPRGAGTCPRRTKRARWAKNPAAAAEEGALSGNGHLLWMPSRAWQASPTPWPRVTTRALVRSMPVLLHLVRHLQ
mmetsp:Transcript_15022/g.45999  ORF Transcript_15022/g.45999 Transcript_15022/m.45999 type:complete len:263 (+) Transcript_15022:342-1130(+)